MSSGHLVDLSIPHYYAACFMCLVVLRKFTAFVVPPTQYRGYT